jgi:trehalose-6-phosphatase
MLPHMPSSRLLLVSNRLPVSVRVGRRGIRPAQAPLEVLDGNKVIEVRLRGIGKALAAQTVDATAAGMTIIAIGDDRTDEELFRALPSSSVTIAVGPRARHAKYSLDDHHAVRRALRTLLGQSRPEAGPAMVNGAVMHPEQLH